MPFQHAIAGGQGNLVVTAVQSPNFVSGSQGWQIRKDGSVEFNNGVFRGVITNTGMYIYSGTPAAGNLVESTGIAVAGLDPIGLNAVLAGDTRYHNNGAGVWVAQNSTQSFIASLYQTTNPAGPWTFMNIQLGFTNEFTSQPFLETIANISAIGGKGGFLTATVTPSGDNTGVTDVANVLFAQGISNLVKLTAGQYYGRSRVNIGFNQAVIGPGWDTCHWFCTGADPGFVIQNTGAFVTNPASLKGIHVDGSMALAGAVAAQIGDLTGIEAEIRATNFTGGNNGILMLNANWFTEQGKFKFRIENCDGGVAFLVSGTGTSSWDRSEFDIEFIQGTAGQEGVVLAAGTLPPILLEPVLRIHGNFAAASTPGTNAVIKMVATGSKILQPRIEIGVECGGGTTGPQTIFFGDPTCQIVNGTGVIDFFEGGGATFVPSNNNYNFWFDGPVLGDQTLITAIPLPSNAQQISGGFPAGWTGTVTIESPRGDGLITADFQLTVANGTVVTSGEVILTAAIPTWARPKVNDKFAAVVFGTGMAPIRIQTTGNVQWLGPGFTGAPTALFGQMTYLNST